MTAIVLKRHSAAQEDGTPVYAKIVGTGLGSDGALEKAGYQVPSPRGQAEVIKSAWNMADGVSPERLRYAEIHGSGTPIGDALELEGLALAMKELGATNHRFTVGSTKGNIGNTQHSSELVSLINPGLPIDLAMQKTPLVESDVLAVSAAGWGGLSTPTSSLLSRKKDCTRRPPLLCQEISSRGRDWKLLGCRRSCDMSNSPVNEYVRVNTFVIICCQL